MCLISIIIPVYNTSAYLDQCVSSVLRQTYTDYEVLLINDGSFDCSGQLCDGYTNRDCRIRVIHQNNQGLAATRRRGLEEAQGEYVIFLDSDDYWVDKEILEKFVKIAKTNDVDIVRGEYVRDIDGCIEARMRAVESSSYNRVMDEGQFLQHVIKRDFFVWLALFRKEKLKHVFVNPARAFLEDMEFWVQTLIQPLKCIYIAEKFYAYRQNCNSISNVLNLRKVAESFSICDVFDKYQKLCKNRHVQKLYQYYSVMNYYWALEAVESLPNIWKKTVNEKIPLKKIHKTVRKRILMYQIFNVVTLLLLLPFPITFFLLKLRRNIYKLKVQ